MQYLVEVAKNTNVAVIMTIHQPSAMVFDMLDDLYLLEVGKLVYAGSILEAKGYFASVGALNPSNINPADYYLDLVQHPPSDSNKTWSELYANSELSTNFNMSLNEAINSSVKRDPSEQPSLATRMSVMFVHFMTYFWKQPGFYVYRLYALIVVGFFSGTLFLQLSPNTEHIGHYSGTMFFSVTAIMLTAVSSCALFAADRREAVDRVANGMYTPGVFVLTQTIASAIYDFVVVFIFVIIFHWLTNLNPNGECFVYNILINWGHVMLMEGFLLVIIEVLKNDFLATTSCMIFLGSNMLFAGFFRKVEDIPVWISWMCYIIPLRVRYHSICS